MSMPFSDRVPPRAFLADGGHAVEGIVEPMVERMAERIAAFDWRHAGLPVVESWPPHMKTATALMLRCRLPMVMLWGERGAMVYNDAYAEFAGHRHPQLLGSFVREGWPEVADFNDHVMKEGLAGRTLSYRDLALTLNRNGRAEQVWLNLDYSPLLDACGVPAGVMAIVVEATAKVRAEALLAGEHERLAQLFEQAPSFMAMLDGPSHVIRLANPKYMELVGQRDVIGRTVAQALPDAAEQGYVRLLDGVWRSGEAVTAHGSRYAMQATPGGPVVERYVDFVFQPIRAPSGEVTGIFVEGVDVTARTAAEQRREALARLTEGLRECRLPADIGFVAAQVLGESLRTSRVGYGTIDDAADTLHVDRDWTAEGIESLAGITPLRHYGSFIDSLKRGEFICIRDVRLDPRTAAAAAALEGKSARSFVNVPVVEQGRLVAVLFVNDAQVRDWTAEDLDFIREVGARTRTAVARAAGAIALRDSEARLREANETLEAKVASRTRELLEAEERFRQAQKMEAIGQLTGGIAHDFNNLLAALSASLQVLARRLRGGNLDDVDRYLGMAEASIRRAASLTQRMLAFSRRQTLDPRPTDVNRLIADLEELIRRSIGPSVSLEVIRDPALWPTRIDPPQLESALLNLCINGRDAMLPDGGSLTVATANAWLDARDAEERDLEAGAYVSVCVTDTGTGMSTDTVARAFDPFFTTKPPGVGTGLGLSMVYGFVRQSGGQVHIRSALGEGTTVCVYLPRFEGRLDAEEPVAAGTAVADAARDACMLVVEDEQAIRELLQDELEALGYRVIAVATGVAALEVLRSPARIDLLLSDVGLPGGVSGRQVADAGRAGRPALEVLFITGYAPGVALGDGLQGENMSVLTKPFDLEVLTGRVRQLLAR